jgi:hypothetical protein
LRFIGKVVLPIASQWTRRIANSIELGFCGERDSVSLLILPNNEECVAMRFAAVMLIALVSVIGVRSAQAVPFATFDVPNQGADGWDRQDAQSTYQEWDVFYDGYDDPIDPNDGRNYVDADRTADGSTVTNPNLFPGTPATFDTYSGFGKPLTTSVATAGTQAGTSYVTQTLATSGAILNEGLPTSGSLYSFAEPTGLNVSVWNYGDAAAASTTLWLQFRTAGSEVNLGTVKLVDPADSNNLLSPGTTDLLSQTINVIQTPAGPQTSITDVYKFVWTVPGNASEYLLKFTAAGPSMSLQNLAVDTFYTVPEPGTLALASIAGLGLVGVGYRRRAARAHGG